MTSPMWWLDALGWAGSVVLILSLSLSNVLRFRVLNLIASIMLTTFNAFLGIWPMVAMNGVIGVINVWHLVKLLRGRGDEQAYDLVAVEPGSEYLAHLLSVYSADIARHNPGFDARSVDTTWAFCVLRRDETVGILLLRDCGDGRASVELDYVTPRFRDLSVGDFVYRRTDRLASLGVQQLIANDRMTDRTQYFTRVGFRDAGDELVRDVRG